MIPSFHWFLLIWRLHFHAALGNIIFTQAHNLSWVERFLLESSYVFLLPNVPLKVYYYPVKLSSMIFVHLSPTFSPILMERSTCAHRVERQKLKPLFDVLPSLFSVWAILKKICRCLLLNPTQFANWIIIPSALH